MKPINSILADLRMEFKKYGTGIEVMVDDPIKQFEFWIEEAVKKKVNLLNAIHLATVGKEGRPSGRILLLKGIDERGFIFYSNYKSRKGKELKSNNHAAMTFFWNELSRQVRIEGDVHKVPDLESDKYFNSRTRESQISAVASEQSQVLERRESLGKRVLDIEESYKGQPVPRPAKWGGYYLSPTSIEFWQGREHRLHDRILYVRGKNNSWTKKRLYP